MGYQKEVADILKYGLWKIKTFIQWEKQKNDLIKKNKVYW